MPTRARCRATWPGRPARSAAVTVKAFGAAGQSGHGPVDRLPAHAPMGGSGPPPGGPARDALSPPDGRGQPGLGHVYLGNIAISRVATAFSWLALTVLGVPYALSLAVVVGFLDLIPLVGATLGAIILGSNSALRRVLGVLDQRWVDRLRRHDPDMGRRAAVKPRCRCLTALPGRRFSYVNRRAGSWSTAVWLFYETGPRRSGRPCGILPLCGRRRVSARPVGGEWLTVNFMHGSWLASSVTCCSWRSTARTARCVRAPALSRFYLAGAFTATMTQTAMTLIADSPPTRTWHRWEHGAIAAVLGAYRALDPGSRVVTLRW
jgi:AI-2E family transporter